MGTKYFQHVTDWNMSHGENKSTPRDNMQCISFIRAMIMIFLQLFKPLVAIFKNIGFYFK